MGYTTLPVTCENVWSLVGRARTTLVSPRPRPLRPGPVTHRRLGPAAPRRLDPAVPRRPDRAVPRRPDRVAPRRLDPAVPCRPDRVAPRRLDPAVPRRPDRAVHPPGRVAGSAARPGDCRADRPARLRAKGLKRCRSPDLDPSSDHRQDLRSHPHHSGPGDRPHPRFRSMARGAKCRSSREMSGRAPGPLVALMSGSSRETLRDRRRFARRRLRRRRPPVARTFRRGRWPEVPRWTPQPSTVDEGPVGATTPYPGPMRSGRRSSQAGRTPVHQPGWRGR